jgi:hypothetical protein
VLETWPKSDAIKAAKQLAKLPEVEHEAVGSILERPEVSEPLGKRIVNALPTLPDGKRAAIYKAMDSDDPDRVISALNAAAAQPLNPEPALLIRQGIQHDFKRLCKRLKDIDEPKMAKKTGDVCDIFNRVTSSLEGRKVEV